ncbi:uncharacterized protein VP01_3749g5 [Puccinia sorghi]|uniref:Uncharacterized protein n=1 Tax=Puccinia sorghi TaxID=27349 RepID=A0A0L6UUP8_9BASI|nr:uncharacterized protein VP01_3749g5 [Puccinia sorghi]
MRSELSTGQNPTNLLMLIHKNNLKVRNSKLKCFAATAVRSYPFSDAVISSPKLVPYDQKLGLMGTVEKKLATRHMAPYQLRRMLAIQTKLASSQKAAGGRQPDKSLMSPANLLSDSKKFALASVQGLDHVRRTIIHPGCAG